MSDWHPIKTTYRDYPIIGSYKDKWAVRNLSDAYMIYIADSLQEAREWIDEMLDGDDAA